MGRGAAGAPPRSALIPRIVHRLWIGELEPEWSRQFAASWERPGWELRQWGEKEVQSLVPLRNQRIYDAAPEIVPRHVGQLRSDLLRFEILHRLGGVYVDADFECLRPIDPLIDGARCFAAWEVPGRWINGAIMGSTAGNPFLEELIAAIPSRVQQLRGLKPNRLTGPHLITDVWRRRGERGLRILERRHFYPFAWHQFAQFQPGAVDPAEQWPRAYAVHWWANKRREASWSQPR